MSRLKITDVDTALSHVQRINRYLVKMDDLDWASTLIREDLKDIEALLKKIQGANEPSNQREGND